MEPPGSVRIIVGSAVAGVLLAVVWSFELVDSVIGANVADTLLGGDARADAIAGTTAALLFAFVSGLAGTFTACNIAMIASIGPLAQAGDGTGTWRVLFRPVGYLALGTVVVSAAYGFVGVLLGDRLPQLSSDRVGDIPVRLIQSSVVFGLIGVLLIYLGVTALHVVRDPLARRPRLRVFLLGALIGGFLIGRPYPLFNKLFHWAVDTGNPFYGAAVFVLQSLGNIALAVAVFALLVVVTRGGFPHRLAGDSRRAAVVSGSLLVALGVFTVVYWVLRVPARFGVGWFPMMPWN
ncbi:hypothetical protein DMB66_48060 [Actinoplanes sp. ATCC 53533]|nr:hypothetical protein DMB66_48060 [Actinoplanes sp. ATCC 53533]